MNTRIFSAAALTLAVFGLVAQASAAEFSDLLDDVVLTIQADTMGQSPSTGFVEITQGDGWWEGNVFTALVANPITIYDDQGNPIGGFGGPLDGGGFGVSYVQYILPEAGAKTNPQVNLGFAMIAGAVPTHFSATSALMPAGVNNPDGKASVGINIQDFGDAEGALLTGDNNGYAYTALYNTGSSIFNQAIQSVSAPAWGGNNSVSADSGWQPIAGSVANISAMIEFTLSAGDLANGTSTFQVTPEPTSLLLVALGALFARRRA